MKNLLKLFAVVSVFAFCLSCSSPASRYVKYRLKPDRLPVRGEKVIQVPGLSEQVEIYFDEYAVPHIDAQSEKGASYAMGYMHGRDRRFELETLRLLALGRMRELAGDMDETGVMMRLEIMSRMIGLGDDGQRILKSATKEDVELLQAYADGINAATEIEPVPMEFRLLNYTPNPWTVEDSTTITALISFGLCKNWEQELARLELIVHQLRSGGSIERALEIWKPRFNLPPHLIGEAPEKDPFADIPPVPPELAEYLKEFASALPPVEAKSAGPAVVTNQPLDSWLRGGSASNNWAMSGKWTGTGKGAYSSDPHMPHMLPSLGYLVHINCANSDEKPYNVIGAVFMGMPAVAFGTNGHVAWGPTSNWGDVTDIFVEKTDAAHPGQYLYKGKWLDFGERSEEFLVRKQDGTYDKEIHKARTTVHGVVLNDFVEKIPADFPVVALTRASDPGKPIYAIRNLYKAENVTQAREALYDFAAMIGHWSLADDKGNIAYCGPMQLPHRTKHLGTIPAPGWTGTYDWESYIPVRELPYLENPLSGFIGTANNLVIQPESLGYPINFEGNVAHRWARISEVLGKGRTSSPIVRQIGTLQTDAKTLGWVQARPSFESPLLALKKDPDPQVAEAAQILLDWNGVAGPKEIGPALFNGLTSYILQNTIEDEMSEDTTHFIMTYFNAEPFIFGILADKTNPAWDDRRTDKVETADEVITANFRVVVAAMVEKYGKNTKNWRWEKTAPFILTHPFGGQKALAKFLNRGPYPTTGSTDTVFKNQFQRAGMVYFPIKYGPVLRIMVDFNDIPGSRMCLPGGQSGRPTNKHYDDQIDMFFSGDGVSMEMNMKNIVENADAKITLQPK